MKEEKEFYFSVEGNTEKEYLLWLEEIINQSTKRPVKFNILVTNSPLKIIRSLPSEKAVNVFHFCDMESRDIYHQEQFKKIIDNLNKAKDSPKINNYYLGYSNYSFELWLILHKYNAFSSISHRKNYLKIINHIFKTDFPGLQDFKRKVNLKKIFKQFTLEDVKAAIKREKEIRKHNQLNNYTEVKYKGYAFYYENPSSTVGSCIEKILEECKCYE